MTDIPLSTFRGHLRQMETNFALPMMGPFFDAAFSAFKTIDEGRAGLAKDNIRKIVTASGTEVNFGSRPRRFAGGPGLAKGSYFTVCSGPDFNDHGALRDEMTAYFGGDSGILAAIFDPTTEPFVKDLVREAGAPEDAPFLMFIYEVCRQTAQNAPLLALDPEYLGQKVAITYGVRQTEAEIEAVLDLRRPDAQEWFARTFIALEVAGRAIAEEQSGIRFLRLAPDLTTFAELLPTLLNLQTGGGSTFSQAVGQWLRHHGVSGLIFPSTRANAFVTVERGEPVEWGGWNLVLYAHAEPPTSEQLFGMMANWSDPDHDHLRIHYDAEGDGRGSFKVRGSREFNLIDFDIKKRIAAGVMEDNVAADVTGVRNDQISRLVNRVLDAEGAEGVLWTRPLDYMSFVEWLEQAWRRPPGDA